MAIAAYMPHKGEEVLDGPSTATNPNGVYGKHDPGFDELLRAKNKLPIALGKWKVVFAPKTTPGAHGPGVRQPAQYPQRCIR